MSGLSGKQSLDSAVAVSSSQPRRVLGPVEIDAIRRQRGDKVVPGEGDRPFKDADARGADLSEVDWSGVDFSGCDLRGANLSGCTFAGADFRDADLWNTDLRDTNLSGAHHLLPAQLAATDLTRVTLPSDLPRFEALGLVESLTQNSTRIFVTILVAVLYTHLTLATTKDLLLMMNTGGAKLPVIGVEIPMLGFLGLTPVILLGLFLYFHLLLLRLWETLAKLPAIFPDGRRIDEMTSPWLMSDLVRMRFPRLGLSKSPLALLQIFIAGFLGWGLVPVTLLAVWAKSIRTELAPMIAWETIVLAAGVGFSIAFARLLRHAFRSSEERAAGWRRAVRWLTVGWGLPVTAGVLLVFGLWSWGIYEAEALPETGQERGWHNESEPELQKLERKAVVEKLLHELDDSKVAQKLGTEHKEALSRELAALDEQWKKVSAIKEDLDVRQIPSADSEQRKKLEADRVSLTATLSAIQPRRDSLRALMNSKGSQDLESRMEDDLRAELTAELATLKRDTGQDKERDVNSQAVREAGPLADYAIRLFHFFVRPSCLVDSGDVAGKPANWTGVAKESERELALVPGARLEERRLRHLHAFNTFFAKTNFSGADLTGAQLDFADLRGVILHANSAPGARFNDAFFGDQMPAHVAAEEKGLISKESFEKFYNVSQKTYHLADVDSTDFRHAHFARATLARLKVRNCEFSGANFESGNLVHTDFVDCGFMGSIFNLASIEDAVFRLISFEIVGPWNSIAAKTMPVNLKGATFTGAYAAGARFLGCDLTDAVFTRADLHKCIFAQSSLENAVFDGADLSDADLTTASGMTVEQFQHVSSLAQALLPEKLRPTLQNQIDQPLPPRKKADVLEAGPTATVAEMPR